MEQTLVMATQNPFKLAEAKQVLEPLGFRVLHPKEAGYSGDLTETGTSLEANATQKAEQLYKATGFHAFADDTGLEVYSLRGQPGVYSARYAGEKANAEDNMKKLLLEMAPMDERKARFRTVIALFLNGCLHLFEGSVDGHINKAPKGAGGFGYDPVFVPEGGDRTFAEFESEEKNDISHRGRALRAMEHYLKHLENMP